MIRNANIAILTFVLLAICTVSAQQIPQTGSQAAGGGGNIIPPAAAAAARSAAGGSGVTAVPEDFSNLRIAPGFLLEMDVFDEPEMSVELRVDSDGNIAVPLIGTMHVADATLAEVRSGIESKLKAQQILLHPQVTINVEQYAPFNIAVLGEVQSPGRIQLLASHNLLDILSMVGGETAMAGGEVEVRHGEGDEAKVSSYPYARGGDGQAISKVLIHSGDTVIVPRAGIVYVLGAVFRPGGYLMQEDGGLNVAQALALAMGTTLQAKVGSIRVIRRNPDGTGEDFTIDYKAISEGKQKPLSLRAQDIVYVPVSKPKAIMTTGASIISEATYATVYAAK